MRVRDIGRVELGALHPTRDFCYVEDTVVAFEKSIDAPGIDGEVINVGTGHEISIGDTARLIAQVMDREVEFASVEQRVRPGRSEVERLCAANGRAKTLLAWEPGYAGRDGLRRGLAETIAWFSDPANLARYRAGSYTV